MKLPVLKPSAFLAMVLPLAVCLPGSFVQMFGQDSSPRAEQTAATPAPLEASPAAATPSLNATRKGKGNKGQDASKQVASQEIPMIVPIGEIIRNVFIPQNSNTGAELSKLFATKMKRIDDDHMEIEGMKMNLNQPDGKTDFFIEVPTSIFNLKTRIIHSDQPITIRTQDFELSGEKMEFDTVARSGKLFGRVEMRIHNLKQVAGQSDENANE